MKYIIGLMCLLLVTACNNSGDSKTKQADSTATPGNSTPAADTLATYAQDSVTTRQHAVTILGLIKAKNISALDTFIHATDGLRFSPYAYVDTIQHKKLSSAELAALNGNKTVIQWGIYDGSGEEIRLTLDKYLDKFVYDQDFLSAPQISYNHFLGGGNSLNNLREVYPGASFMEFYFPGFDPKYEGMDWRSLRLVFKKENDKYYLLAVIHDQWTI